MKILFKKIMSLTIVMLLVISIAPFGVMAEEVLQTETKQTVEAADLLQQHYSNW